MFSLPKSQDVHEPLHFGAFSPTPLRGLRTQDRVWTFLNTLPSAASLHSFLLETPRAVHFLKAAGAGATGESASKLPGIRKQKSQRAFSMTLFSACGEDFPGTESSIPFMKQQLFARHCAKWGCQA